MPCGSLCESNFAILMNTELSIKLIRELEKAPKQSQRALSQSCGVSLGSIHYCLNALIRKRLCESEEFQERAK